jgi:hypothetical protein
MWLESYSSAGTGLQSGFTAIALQVNAYLLVINTVHYCVMVIVRATVWLFAPVPLVDAVRVTVLDPAGVPEFAGLLLLPHEARLTANNARAQRLQAREPRRARLRPAAMPKIIPTKGSSSA